MHGVDLTILYGDSEAKKKEVAFAVNSKKLTANLRQEYVPTAGRSEEKSQAKGKGVANELRLQLEEEQ